MTYDNLTSLEGIIKTFEEHGWILREHSETKVVFRAIVIDSLLLFLMTFMFSLGLVGSCFIILLSAIFARDLEITICLSNDGELDVSGSIGNFTTDNRFEIVPPREGIFGSRKRFNSIAAVAGLFVTIFYIAIFLSA